MELGIEKLKEIGINTDNFVPFGEMNIIVQCHGIDDTDDEFDPNDINVYPDIYQPRKNRVWSCSYNGEPINLNDEEEKTKHIKHLKDSAERLKIMSYLLSKQAEEIEEFGYPKTTCYYPE